MTEKIMITREQFEAMEDEQDGSSKAVVLRMHIGGWEFERNQCLNKLAIDEFARILYEPDSYEVETEFKIGDWVTWRGELTGRVIELEGEGCLTDIKGRRFGSDQFFGYTQLRHATPKEIKTEKERQLWKSFGREVNEWIHGDCIVIDGDYVRVNAHMGCDDENFNNVSPKRAAERMNCGDVDGIFPTESFISFEEGESDD